jgi:hypothetical protein
MPDGNVIVSSGLVRDMDDDELAVVVGHELAHITNEHRKGQIVDEMIRKAMQEGAKTSLAAIHNPIAKLAAIGAGALAYKAGTSMYSRNQEDKADRIGLRYAQRGGFDISKAPAVWRKFEKKYGDGNKVVNTLFVGHSRHSERAENLQKELTTTYRGWSEERRLNAAKAPALSNAPQVNAAARVEGPTPVAGGRGLAEPVGASALLVQPTSTAPIVTAAPVTAGDKVAAPAKGAPKQVTAAMSFKQVKKLRGEPASTTTFRTDTLWVYADGTRVVFHDGLVKTVLRK